VTTPPIDMRALAVEAIARWLIEVRLPHPVRVAVDGPDAAGKTTLADAVAAELARRGRAVIRASADDFARPRADRYRQGRDSPDGYRQDSFDHAALIRLLLAPLGPGGDRRYRTASFDLSTDAPVDAEVIEAAPDAILLVDGVFLQQPDLLGAWDRRIFVACAPELSLARALARDVPALGDAATVEALYRTRYLPAQADYRRLDRPQETAELVVDNDDPLAPRLRLHPDAMSRRPY
jgi:uridine kinase